MKFTFSKKTVACCSLLVLLAGLLVISGCTQNAAQGGVQTPPIPPTTPVTTASTTLPPPPTPPPTTAAAVFDVKINSLSCKWTVKTGDYNVKSDCVRVISNGTARGPVGARLELPILSWSDDKFTCGSWTLRKGALIAVGSTCVREAGQPESTAWRVDTEGDNCPIKSYFATSITHTVKIYNDDDLTPKAQDSETAGCK
jgi:hypothetical protein